MDKIQQILNEKGDVEVIYVNPDTPIEVLGEGPCGCTLTPEERRYFSMRGRDNRAKARAAIARFQARRAIVEMRKRLKVKKGDKKK